MTRLALLVTGSLLLLMPAAGAAAEGTSLAVEVARFALPRERYELLADAVATQLAMQIQDSVRKGGARSPTTSESG